MIRKITLLLVLCVISFFNISPYVVCADSESSQIEENLNSQIIKDLSSLDFSDLDATLSDLQSVYKFLPNLSAKDLLLNITSGKYFQDYTSVFDAVINLIFYSVKSIIPLIVFIVAIAILGSILNTIKSSNTSSVSNLIHFVCFSVVVLLLSSSITSIMQSTTATLNSLTNLMQIVFPVMLTLLTATGGLVSVGIYKPIVSILSSGVSIVFSKFLFPLFVLSFLFLVIGNLSKNVSLSKFNEFISSIFKWVVGFVCTMFSAFLVVQGISAGKYDGISLKATKFAVKSYIPLIGGFISDGFDLIICSSILIKNAVGVVGIVLIILSIISPIIQILVLKFSLQLISAILQPVGDSRICEFCNGCSKILVYPIVLILAVAFMFFLSTGLIMSTANLI